MPKLSGNKGEWSEIFVFLRALSVGKLYAADENLHRVNDVFYNIIHIVRNENIGVLEFRVNKSNDTISVFNTETQQILSELPMEVFAREAYELYNEIVSANTSSFSVDETENFLTDIGVETLKARSTDKSDIRIKIHDINTGYESLQGFSIKSRLGSPSTLINAGKTTNFVYEVTGNMSDAVMDEFNTCSKLFRARFASLYHNNCDIAYCGMENDIFESNLLLLDSSLPEICAEMLKMFFATGIANVKEGLEAIAVANPLNYNLSKGHPFYSYKFKKLLTECALGMLPSKTWNGTADATGGYIIVREDGEVLCYHLFNRNEFENYLINNTKFETASTSRHDFGSIYKENGKYYLKLNLQIRFIK